MHNHILNGVIISKHLKKYIAKNYSKRTESFFTKNICIIRKKKVRVA